MWSPIGWLKSRNEWCDLSIGLYIDLAPLYIKYAEKLQKKWFDFINSLANIIPENLVKVSKIKCFKPNQQTLIIAEYAALHMPTGLNHVWLKQRLCHCQPILSAIS